MIKAALTNFGSTKFKVVSADLMWTLRGLTALEGGIEVGIVSNDLTIAEAIEGLDASPTSKSDVIAMERIRRPVRRLGTFSGLNVNDVLNNGKPIRTKLFVLLDTGIELDAWIRNIGSTLTTGATIEVSGRVYGYWA